MIIQKLHFLILTAFFWLSVSCSMASPSSTEDLFVASTPADDSVRSIFGIPAERQIDFIRWSLKLDEDKKFNLSIIYGESQPNTNGFKNGGEKLSLAGSFVIKDNIYELRSENLYASILLAKLSENLLHLLTVDGKLMIGNGGWSYTLNKKSAEKFQRIWKSVLSNRSAQEMVFDGRTPCSEISRNFDLPVTKGCIKIKWRLTLFRDAITNEPTTYALRWIQYSPNLIEGKWSIKQNSDEVIYQIELDKSGESLLFLVGDENILFFLDKRNQLLTGNSDFSFTLNRKK